MKQHGQHERTNPEKMLDKIQLRNQMKTTRMDLPQTVSSEVVTVKEAAVMLSCSQSFVYKLISKGELSHDVRGSRKLPLVASIREYIANNRVPAKVGHLNKPSTVKNYKHLRLS
jgi:excisionase family DNA binding protein